MLQTLSATADLREQKDGEAERVRVCLYCRVAPSRLNGSGRAERSGARGCECECACSLWMSGVLRE
eukprot:scaffold4297_cov103-Isochrysis_galbana.AAC.6